VRNASQISFGDYDRDGATDMLVATTDFRLPAAERAAGTRRCGSSATSPRRRGNGFFNVRLAGAARINLS